MRIFRSALQELLMNMLIKAADVSNEVRPFEVSMPWINCLATEFGAQFELENHFGITPTPFMNMKKISKASSQIGFIKFVLIPLYESLAMIFPSVNDHMLGPIRRSLSYWLAVENEMAKSTTVDTAAQLNAMISELKSYDLTPSNIMLRMHKY